MRNKSDNEIADELVPDDQVKGNLNKSAQGGSDWDWKDRLHEEWYDKYVLLNDNTFGLVVGVVDPNTLNVDLYVEGHGEISEDSHWKTTYVPLSSINRKIPSREVDERLREMDKPGTN